MHLYSATEDYSIDEPSSGITYGEPEITYGPEDDEPEDTPDDDPDDPDDDSSSSSSTSSSAPTGAWDDYQNERVNIVQAVVAARSGKTY